MNRIFSYNRSALQEERIFFERYNAKELKEILKDRVDRAFKKNIIDEDLIAYLAAKIVQGDKTVRDSLKALMKVGQKLNKEIKNGGEIRKLEVEDLDFAFKNLETEYVKTTIKGLSQQEFLILSAIVLKKDKKVYSKVMYDRYRQLCKLMGLDPNSYRYVRGHHIPSLENQGLIRTAMKGKKHGGLSSFVSQTHTDICTLVHQTILNEDYYAPLRRAISGDSQRFLQDF